MQIYSTDCIYKYQSTNEIDHKTEPGETMARDTLNNYRSQTCTAC